MISADSYDELSSDHDCGKRSRKPVARYSAEPDGTLKDDFSPEEYAEFELLEARDHNQLGKV